MTLAKGKRYCADLQQLIPAQIKPTTCAVQADCTKHTPFFTHMHQSVLEASMHLSKPSWICL